ncbi:ABC transporter permease [Citrobacter amalonaticus]|uniref:ABC transporter permease n=1 Tax=Citrobacter amalonaticus TaxID=35703 RepID=UPI000B30CA78|nr:ABC transporter permease [Citrobacter amalonaticus]
MAEANMVIPSTPQRSLGLRQFLRLYARSKSALVAALLVGLIIIIAFAAPLLAPQNPYDLQQLSIIDGQLAPGAQSSTGILFWLGSDDQGRDMLSAILYGLRISLGVGFVSVFCAAIIGGFLGLLAAYRGGKTDALIMRLVDLQLSFPAILVALMLLAFLGKGIGNVVLALVIVEWATYARATRSTALVESKKGYIEAVVCLGLPLHRILFRHLLPQCMPPLIVISTVQVARAIALEATLSFLGLGVPVTEPSLGMLIANGYQYMLSGEYWICFYPGIALMVTIVAINMAGDRLRDVLNPWTR